MLISASKAPIAAILFFSLFVCILEVCFSGGIPRDQLEAVFWGRELVSISTKHPTLSGWIHYGWLITFGNSKLSGHGIPVVNVLISLLIYVRLLRSLELKRDHVLISLWGVLASLNLYFLLIKYNANSATLPFWLTGMLGLWLGHSKKMLAGWVLAGIAAGLAVLVKYHSLVWLAAAFFWLLSGEEERKNWKTPGPWIALTLFLAIIGAHIWDLLRWGGEDGFSYAASNLTDGSSLSGHIRYPLHYSVIQIIGASPAFIVLIFMMRSGWRSISHASAKSRFLFFFGVFFPLSPALIALVTGGEMGAIWGIGTSMMSIPWLLHVVGSRDELTTVAKRLGIGTAITLAVLLIAFQGKRDPEYQIETVQRTIEDALSAEELLELELVAGETCEAQGATWYLSKHPRMMKGHDFTAQPWIAKRLPEGALVLLEGHLDEYDFGTMAPQFVRSFTVSLPQHSGYAFPARAYSATWSIVRLKSIATDM